MGRSAEIGLRLRHQFAPGWNFVASGDIGGFGRRQQDSWQALAALNYDFYVHNNVTWSGMVGYKAISVDYSKGSGLNQFVYDMTMHGPIIGVTARFLIKQIDPMSALGQKRTCAGATMDVC